LLGIIFAIIKLPQLREEIKQLKKEEKLLEQEIKNQ
jgi:hypothetical protein